MSKLIAVYGSLRKGQYNYDRFGGERAFVYHGTFIIPGFKLYSLGPYPAVIEADKYDKITVDLLETSDSTAKIIDSMEIGAGYSTEPVKIDGKIATIYLYDGRVDEKNFIKSGDWSQYLKQKQDDKILADTLDT